VNPRINILLAAVLPAVLTGGCIEHYPVDSAEMDRLWTLRPDPAEGATLYRPTVSGTRLPGRWIIRNEDSLLRSTISIVRAADQLEQGAEVIDLSVSAEHAQMLSSVLRDTQDALQGLRELAEGEAGENYEQWSQSLGHVLAQLERIARLAGAETEAVEGTEEPVGLSARPLLEMLVLYANEQTGGQLLGDLGPGEAQKLRQALGQFALRLGFALAGREVPPGLREDVLQRLRQAEDPYAAEREVAERLLAAARTAPPVTAEGTLPAQVRSAMDGAAKAIRVLDGFVQQWDRVERIEAALLRRDGVTIVEGLVAARPGRELRLVDIMPFQPVVAFRGTSRITILPKAAKTGEVVVSFAPEDDESGVQLRFEGIVYALARLLVMPIGDGRLREIRVLADRPKTGSGMIHTAVFMEATGSSADPRRMLVYKEVRRRDLSREAFSVEYPQEQTERTFSYVTPTRRYTYYRLKGAVEAPDPEP
jgi:hypothetical protein